MSYGSFLHPLRSVNILYFLHLTLMCSETDTILLLHAAALELQYQLMILAPSVVSNRVKIVIRLLNVTKKPYFFQLRCWYSATTGIFY